MVRRAFVIVSQQPVPGLFSAVRRLHLRDTEHHSTRISKETTSQMSLSLRAPTRTLARFLAVGMVIAVLASCRPMTSPEASLFVSTNSFRRANGLGALAQQDALVDQARGLASAMAARGQLFHSDPNAWNVQWSAVAENVGVSGTIEDIVSRLEASPEHRANMLSTKYTHMAVGTARGKDGRIYAAQLFWRG
jgi:uncharacterized protein YkwD